MAVGAEGDPSIYYDMPSPAGDENENASICPKTEYYDVATQRRELKSVLESIRQLDEEEEEEVERQGYAAPPEGFGDAEDGPGYYEAQVPKSMIVSTHMTRFIVKPRHKLGHRDIPLDYG